MYTCRVAFPGTARAICGGHGHRISQIAFTLRAAAATRRVVLIDWVSPEPLERYFEPSMVDWRLTAAEQQAVHSVPVVAGFNKSWYTDEPPARSSPAYVRVSRGMLWSSRCRGCDTTTGLPTLFHFLFRPTRALLQDVRRVRASLFGSELEYNAMHVRMGDTAAGSRISGETWIPSRASDVRTTQVHAVQAIACAATYSKRPLFVATDNAALKRALLVRDARLVLNGTRLPRLLVPPGWRALGQSDTRAIPPPLGTVFVHGCTDCMVNAVHRHNFSADSLRSIVLDLGLLEGATQFFHLGKSSNYMLWAQAWRGERRLKTSVAFPEVCYRRHEAYTAPCPPSDCIRWQRLVREQTERGRSQLATAKSNASRRWPE